MEGSENRGRACDVCQGFECRSMLFCSFQGNITRENSQRLGSSGMVLSKSLIAADKSQRGLNFIFHSLSRPVKSHLGPFWFSTSSVTDKMMTHIFLRSKRRKCASVDLRGVFLNAVCSAGVSNGRNVLTVSYFTRDCHPETLLQIC